MLINVKNTFKQLVKTPFILMSLQNLLEEVFRQN